MPCGASTPLVRGTGSSEVARAPAATVAPGGGGGPPTDPLAPRQGLLPARTRRALPRIHRTRRPPASRSTDRHHAARSVCSLADINVLPAWSVCSLADINVLPAWSVCSLADINVLPAWSVCSLADILPARSVCSLADILPARSVCSLADVIIIIIMAEITVFLRAGYLIE